jgi:hypothetical protein
MKRSTFIAAGGAATRAGCAHGQVLPTTGAPKAPASAVKSAASLDAAKKMRRFDGKTPPPGWTFCNGAPLTIASNKNLFAILGKGAGGDGKKTFASQERPLAARDLFGRRVHYPSQSAVERVRAA